MLSRLFYRGFFFEQDAIGGVLALLSLFRIALSA